MGSDPSLLIPHLPHLKSLQTIKYVFNLDFGISSLPTEGELLLICGARQYGKSTWLEQKIVETISQFGPGSAQYLNCTGSAWTGMPSKDISYFSS